MRQSYVSTVGITSREKGASLERLPSMLYSAASFAFVQYAYVYSIRITALIAIGIRNGPLEKIALEAAARIGSIEVDHKETGCKTPEAVSYIRQTRVGKREKENKKSRHKA